MKKEASTAIVLKFFWKYIKMYIWHTLLLCTVYGAALILRMIFAQRKVGQFIDSITIYNGEHSLKYLLVFGAFLFIAQVCFRIGDYLVIYVQRHTLTVLHRDVFERLIYKPAQMFADTFSGALAGQSKRVITSYENFYDIATWQLWTSLVVVLGTITAIVFTEWHIGLICITWLATYIIYNINSLKKQKIVGNLSAEQDSRLSGILVDTFSNIRAVKSYATEEDERMFFEGEVEKQAQYWWRLWVIQNWQISFHGFSSIIVQISMFGLSLFFWHKGSLTAGDIVAIQLYFSGVPDRMRELSRQFTRMIESVSNATEAISRVVDTSNDESKKWIPTGEKDFTGAISIENISFTYTDSDGTVLKDISLEIPAGQKVGVVGRSGSGKSTLVNLFMRFYDIQKGAIKIDGKNISELGLQTLRTAITFVPQEPILFHRTIRENIEYGLDRKLSTEELIQISTKAHAHEFISTFPKGYDTVVGERGVKLSGGQRQRIAIARAMAKNAPIIILDEATSALDSESEQVIQSSFEELMNGRTTIAIAHRLSTLKHMDRIIVLEDGAIKEDGTHAELLKKKGRYFELWEHQTNGFIAV